MITKCIIPVAGFGTRFLPATKAQPKEMLPIVDKPIIQFLVEEAVASGITDIIFITGRCKRAIEDHFDCSFELEHNLVEQGKHQLLKKVRFISKMANFFYVRQPEPLGTGHAVLCARKLIGNEPVAVMFGDDLVDAKVPCLRQLINAYEKLKEPIIALTRISKKDISRFGMVEATKIDKQIYKIERFIEKPSFKESFSNLIFVGKSIITPDIFDTLSKLYRHSAKKKGGELGLPDAFSERLKKSLYGYEFDGVRYDCGSKIGFLKATVDFGLRHPDVGKEFRQYLKKKI